MLLKDRIAVITGSSRGIGRAIAIEMARQGAAVVINANKSAEAAKAVVSDITQEGGTAIAELADVSDPNAVGRMMANVRDRLGPIDVLVNNAAVDNAIAFEDISAEEWDRVLAVNLKGVHNCCKAAVEDMKARQYGKIIMISSVAGLRGSLFGNAHYAASKAGMHGFAMTLARYLAPYQINVNIIAPGPIETEMFRENVGEEGRQKVLAQVPLGFIGQPEDIAHAAVFLASDWARFITGEILRVNGGSLMG
jgi:3-oxoacyl-[acyl-carrier protein] reductase